MSEILAIERDKVLKKLAALGADIESMEGNSLGRLQEKLELFRDNYRRTNQAKNAIRDLTDAGINDLASEYGVSYDRELFENDPEYKNQIIERLANAKLSNKKRESINYSSDVQSYSDSKQNNSVAANIEDLEQIRENLTKLQKDKTTPYDTLVQAKNLEISTTNRIRQALGLQEQPLILTNADLEALLLIDGGEIGNTCDEFLEQQRDSYWRDRYHRELREMAMLRKMKQERIEKDRNERIDIKLAFDNLTKDVPSKLVQNKATNGYMVNQDYLTWIENMNQLKRKLENKLKGISMYESNSESPIESENKTYLVSMKNRLESVLSEHN